MLYGLILLRPKPPARKNTQILLSFNLVYTRRGFGCNNFVSGWAWHKMRAKSAPLGRTHISKASMICQAICMKTNFLAVEWSFEKFSLNGRSSKAAENMPRSEVYLSRSASLRLHKLCMPSSLWITVWSRKDINYYVITFTNCFSL